MLSIHAVSKEVQVIVIANSAPIYSESHSESYKIETVKKGTVLTLFESGTKGSNWLYVSYQSPRWRAKVTGFIQSRLVEKLSDKKPAEMPKEEIREAKDEPEVKEIPALTSLPPYKKYSLTDARASWENPRWFSLKVESRADTSVSPAKVVPIIKEKRKESAFEVREESVKAEEKVPLKPGKEVVIPKVEVVAALTSLPPYKKYSLTDARASWENPRLFSLKVESRADTSVSRAKVVPIIKGKRKESAFEVREESVKVEEKAEAEKEEEPQVRPKKIPRLGKPSWLTLSLGYGPSGGSGLGGFVQVNLKNGFSLHFGAGYYPTSYYYSEYDWAKNRILYSVGVKYYLPFGFGRIRPYLDLQYGGISVEAVRVVTGIWYSQYTYENIQKTLLGPTFLAGAEIKTGAIGLNVAFGLSYNTTKWEYWDRDYFLTGDVGLLIFF